MTQQPFSRPGAVDLTSLTSPAPGGTGPSGAPAASAAPAGAAGAASAGGAAYAIAVDEQNFQTVLESSRTAPVLLVFYSPTQSPDSARLAEDMVTLSEEFEGRFLLGSVDFDAVPAIAQAMQIPSIPLVIAVISGRPMPLFQEVVPLEELRAAMTQVMQQVTAQGITSRHQPLTSGAAEGEEEVVDPRYAAAEDALTSGDEELAITEYQKLIDANPADSEAALGLNRAKLLQRTRDADLNAARTAAAERPDDVAAQTLVADLDLLGGHVEDAFGRLIELVRRSSGSERDAARAHLIDLFAVVGNDDARVLQARRNLASALF